MNAFCLITLILGSLTLLTFSARTNLVPISNSVVPLADTSTPISFTMAPSIPYNSYRQYKVTFVFCRFDVPTTSTIDGFLRTHSWLDSVYFGLGSIEFSTSVHSYTGQADIKFFPPVVTECQNTSPQAFDNPIITQYAQFTTTFPAVQRLYSDRDILSVSNIIQFTIPQPSSSDAPILFVYLEDLRSHYIYSTVLETTTTTTKVKQFFHSPSLIAESITFSLSYMNSSHGDDSLPIQYFSAQNSPQEVNASYLTPAPSPSSSFSSSTSPTSSTSSTSSISTTTTSFLSSLLMTLESTFFSFGGSSNLEANAGDGSQNSNQPIQLHQSRQMTHFTINNLIIDFTKLSSPASFDLVFSISQQYIHFLRLPSHVSTNRCSFYLPTTPQISIPVSIRLAQSGQESHLEFIIYDKTIYEFLYGSSISLICPDLRINYSNYASFTPSSLLSFEWKLFLLDNQHNPQTLLGHNSFHTSLKKLDTSSPQRKEKNHNQWTHTMTTVLVLTIFLPLIFIAAITLICRIHTTRLKKKHQTIFERIKREEEQHNLLQQQKLLLFQR